MDEARFADIEDLFREYIEMGLDREVIADQFGIDREEFAQFIDSNEYALSVYRQSQSRFKITVQRGRLAAIEKGNVSALKQFEEVKPPPKITIEFKRGDMRTPDEIVITNSEDAEKKSLESLLCWEASSNL